MKIKNIEFPTALEKVKDIEDDNIDVFVELEDGMTYTLVVATPKNLLNKWTRNKLIIFLQAHHLLLLEH
ncbi:hypothetical protein [Bacillus sp. SM2101]|uniref:hypothetical protein n=1 Tax=Bacillus sp. SM2101 TaxID=2805366 RepID=UPI001BDE022F|nr:hypothetical protein [Bacillus sp. SM2101]